MERECDREREIQRKKGEGSTERFFFLSSKTKKSHENTNYYLFFFFCTSRSIFDLIDHKGSAFVLLTGEKLQQRYTKGEEQ